MFKKKFVGDSFSFIANCRLLAVSADATSQTAVAPIPNLTQGWTQVPFKFEVQHPLTISTSKVATNSTPPATRTISGFFFKDKPPTFRPPNETTARTEMRLENFTNGEHMFDADMCIQPGTFACIGQVFDADHGPVTMIVAHPDGTVTIGRDCIKTNAIGKWWN